MTDQPGSGPPEMIGFELTHALFRNELPRLASAFDNDTDQPVDVVTEGHLQVVTDHLLRHHDEEETFHFHLLAERDPATVGVIRQLQAQHETLQGLLSAARDRERPRLARALALRTLADATVRHLDIEDAEIVPKLHKAITAQEQANSMARSRAKIPAGHEARVLAAMLDAANPGQLRRMLAVLPDGAIDHWRATAGPDLRAAHAHLDHTAQAPQGA